VIHRSTYPRPVACALTLSVLTLAACAGAEEGDSGSAASDAGEATASQATVRIVEPADGATVDSPVRIVLEVNGLRIVPAGTEEEGTGHHHVIIDGEAPPSGVPIPSTEGYVHLGQAQTETEVELEPGEHTIVAAVGDFAHRSLDPPVEHTIRIVVR
jgi:hypothetical protein